MQEKNLSGGCLLELNYTKGEEFFDDYLVASALPPLAKVCDYECSEDWYIAVARVL